MGSDKVTVYNLDKVSIKTRVVFIKTEQERKTKKSCDGPVFVFHNIYRLFYSDKGGNARAFRDFTYVGVVEKQA